MTKVTVQIHTAAQYILSEDSWKWLQANYNKPLTVLSLSFSHYDGSLFCLSVLRDADSDTLEVITLFPDQNQLLYTLEGLDTIC